MKIEKRNKKLITVTIILGVIFILIISFIVYRRMNTVSLDLTENITITSKAFENGGTIPIKYTGVGDDISPDLELSSVSPEAKSIAIVMDDLDFPLGIYNHWIIWNIPVMKLIPEAIPYGAVVSTLDGAVQGKGYGKNRYRGAKPPFHMTHRYKYQVYVLDTKIDLDSNSDKNDLLKKIDGHVLQYGSITGKFY